MNGIPGANLRGFVVRLYCTRFLWRNVYFRLEANDLFNANAFHLYLVMSLFVGLSRLNLIIYCAICFLRYFYMLSRGNVSGVLGSISYRFSR